MTRILIVGAGGHAQVIADLILNYASSDKDLQLMGFVDDNPELFGHEIFGVKVLGHIGRINEFEHDAVVVGIGDNARRARVFDQLKQRGERPISLVHPRATVADDIVLGEGSVVFAGAVINTGSIVNVNVIVNSGATIDHHARVGAHVHVAPGVHLGGAVTVEEGAFLGIGCSVIPKRTIGAWSVVGAGAAVVHDLPAHVTAVGVPARIIKTHPLLDQQTT